MSEPVALVIARVKLLRGSSLFMNALYLMVSTAVVALAGFVFWAVITRRYDPAEVGLATTLLSTSNLLALLGLAGYDTTLVRFLPRTKHRDDHINNSFMVVAAASGVLALGVVLIMPLLSPNLNILASGPAIGAFVFFTVITALNTLTNAVFLAYKQARYILLINSVVGVAKVVLPLMATHGSALTIFVIAGLAQAVGLVLSLTYMRRRFGFRFWPRLQIRLLRTVGKFSFSMYASSILNLLPPTLLPLIILASIGPKNAAYYYMAFTIASMLYTIAYASMQSVFAEGSHDEASMRQHTKQAIKLVGALLIPAALVVALCSDVFLGMFGHEYATGGGKLLQWFTLGALPVAVYSALGALFKVTKNLRAAITMNIVYAVTILGLSYVLVPRVGLLAVGISWTVGNVVACAVGWFCASSQDRESKRN